MTEANNVRELPKGEAAQEKPREEKPLDPKYAVREPNIRDAMMLAGILAEGAENPQVFDAIDAKENQAAMLFLFTGALRNPNARTGMLNLLAGLWDRQIADSAVDEPVDDWEYEPTAQQVKEGMPSREERWRMYSRKTRKIMVKRFQIEELPLPALMQFGRHIAALDSISDFLDSVQKLVPEGSGSSSTGSSGDTPGGATGG